MTKWVTRKELAEHLGVSISTIYNWRNQGVIPEGAYFKASSKLTRYDLEAVEKAVSGYQYELPLGEPTEVDPRSFYRPKGGER